MQELISLTAGLPERTLVADEVLVSEGETPDHLYVLLEGELVVRRGLSARPRPALLSHRLHGLE